MIDWIINLSALGFWLFLLVSAVRLCKAGGDYDKNMPELPASWKPRTGGGLDE